MSGVGKYVDHWKWTERDGINGNARPKGKFMTEEKLTMTASVMKFGKTLPAPNKYNKITQTWKKTVAPRILGTYNNRAEKVCFTEEAQAHSIAIPVNKADPINLELIRNRSQKCFINKTKLLGERMIKI